MKTLRETTWFSVHNPPLKTLTTIFILAILVTGCATQDAHFVPRENQDPELSEYLAAVSKKVYPLWTKILTEKYKDELNTLRSLSIQNLRTIDGSKDRFAASELYQLQEKIWHSPNSRS